MGLLTNRNGRIGLLSPNNFANADPEPDGDGNLPGSGSNNPPGDGSTPSNPPEQEPNTGQSNAGLMPSQMTQAGSGTPNASTGSTNTANGSLLQRLSVDSHCSLLRAKKMTQTHQAAPVEPIHIRTHPHGVLVFSCSLDSGVSE